MKKNKNKIDFSKPTWYNRFKLVESSRNPNDSPEIYLQAISKINSIPNLDKTLFLFSNDFYQVIVNNPPKTLNISYVAFPSVMTDCISRVNISRKNFERCMHLNSPYDGEYEPAYKNDKMCFMLNGVRCTKEHYYSATNHLELFE